MKERGCIPALQTASPPAIPDDGTSHDDRPPPDRPRQPPRAGQRRPPPRRRVAPQRGHEVVVASFLELAEPGILDGGRACVAAGARRVVLLPYFLSAGVHVRRDLTAHARDELAPSAPASSSCWPSRWAGTRCCSTSSSSGCARRWADAQVSFISTFSTSGSGSSYALAPSKWIDAMRRTGNSLNPTGTFATRPTSWAAWPSIVVRSSSVSVVSSPPFCVTCQVTSSLSSPALTIDLILLTSSFSVFRT